MRLFLAILGVIIMLSIHHVHGLHEQFPSPRKQVLAYLASAGCTNKLVAHYVIQASVMGLPATTLATRLKGLATYDTTKLSTWISLVTSYRTKNPIQ